MPNMTYNFFNLQDTLAQYKITDAKYIRYLKDIVNTKISLFKYKNLPDDLTSEIIETALLFRNKLCFYKSKGLDTLILCYYIPKAEFNYYWKPLRVDLLSFNGVQVAQNVPFEDIILVRDNEMDIIPFLAISEYLDKINDIEKTLSSNIKLLRIPLAMVGEKSQVAQINAWCKAITDGKPLLITDKTAGQPYEQMPIQLPISPLDVYQLKKEYYKECLASIGIYMSTDKKERLISNEVSTDNDYVDMIYQGMLEERQRFVEEVNKLGYNIVIEEQYVNNIEDNIDLEKKENDAVGGEKEVKGYGKE